MKFTSDTAKIKYNDGMSKSDLEQGYEIVDSGPSGPGPFRDSCQSAEAQGWRFGIKQKQDAAQEEEMRMANPGWYD